MESPVGSSWVGSKSIYDHIISTLYHILYILHYIPYTMYSLALDEPEKRHWISSTAAKTSWEGTPGAACSCSKFCCLAREYQLKAVEVPELQPYIFIYMYIYT